MCNHPDLFEGRPIVSAFDMWGLEQQLPSAAVRAAECGPFDVRRPPDPARLPAAITAYESLSRWAAADIKVCQQGVSSCVVCYLVQYCQLALMRRKHNMCNADVYISPSIPVCCLAEAPLRDAVRRSRPRRTGSKGLHLRTGRARSSKTDCRHTWRLRHGGGRDAMSAAAAHSSRCADASVGPLCTIADT